MTVNRYFRILSMVAVVSLCVVLVNVGTQSASAGQNPGSQPSSSSPGPKKAEEEFKNIQVLKGVPADQLCFARGAKQRQNNWRDPLEAKRFRGQR